MVTDGADTSDAAIDEPLASLKARSIPVFTVGVGQERFAHDIQVTRVETPRSVLKGTALVVDVVLSQTGYGGQTVPLSVEDDGRIVSTQDVTLPADGESATVKVRFTADEAGARAVPVQGAGAVGRAGHAEQRARRADPGQRPRGESALLRRRAAARDYKFLRRAVEDDKNLQVVSLDRTAENKYYRQGVSNPDELIGGFPKTREELFGYRAIILGSVEAASFTPEQLRIIADFVNKRGGGLLMLGGRRSFAEGGWGGTPVGEVLPVVLGASNAKYLATDISVRPTRAGNSSPVTQIAATEAASTARWSEMPELSAVNLVREVKPGAIGAAHRNRQAASGSRGARLPALRARQGVRAAGAGHVHLADGREDGGHRHDARDVLAASRALARRRRARSGQRHHHRGSRRAGRTGQALRRSARFGVRRSQRQPRRRAHHVAVREDDGHAGRVDGDQGRRVPDDVHARRIGDLRRARHRVDGIRRISARRRCTSASRPATPSTSTPRCARRCSSGLRRKPAAASSRPPPPSALPEAISYSGRGVTVVEERELWDMPVLFLLLVSLVFAEWGFRRARGLA